MYLGFLIDDGGLGLAYTEDAARATLATLGAMNNTNTSGAPT